MPILAGYMVPHPPIAVQEIGRGEENKITDTLRSFETVAKDIAALKPDTLIVTSPHATMYRDYFHISPGREAEGDFGQFRARQVSFHTDYDTELVDTISRLAADAGLPAGTEGERAPRLDHGTLVPLYFIHREYRDYRLVRIGLSGLSLAQHWKLGNTIRDAVEQTGRRAVFIASGDLSHCQKADGPYGYRPEGPAYDRKIMEVMGKGDFEALLHFDEAFLEESMECGHRSFTILGGAFEGTAVRCRPLSHEATFGVGYGFCIYHPEEKSS